MMSKVQCLFCSEKSTTEGRGGEKEGSANFQKESTEPLTSSFTGPLYKVRKCFDIQMDFCASQKGIARTFIMIIYSCAKSPSWGVD